MRKSGKLVKVATNNYCWQPACTDRIQHSFWQDRLDVSSHSADAGQGVLQHKAAHTFGCFQELYLSCDTRNVQMTVLLCGVI